MVNQITKCETYVQTCCEKALTSVWSNDLGIIAPYRREVRRQAATQILTVKLAFDLSYLKNKNYELGHVSERLKNWH